MKPQLLEAEILLGCLTRTHDLPVLVQDLPHALILYWVELDIDLGRLCAHATSILLSQSELALSTCSWAMSRGHRA